VNESSTYCKGIAFLADFSDTLLALNDKAKLAQLALNTVVRVVSPSKASFMVFDLQSRQLTLETMVGVSLNRTAPPRVDVAKEVASFLSHGWDVLGPDPTTPDTFYIVRDPELEDAFEVEIRIPFFIRERFVAVISLGKKETGTDYTVDEMDLLRILMNLLMSRMLQLLPDHPSGHDPETGTSTGIVKGVKTPFRYSRRDDYSEILGHSPAIQRVLDIVDKVAGKDVPVLITGASGTGKELVARAIHRKSVRADHPLVAMNCAALQDSLVESELFGHERGAFTGANAMKKGKFEFANQSSLFLDEIADMSLTTQAKLLRVLQDGSLQRIGGNQTLHVDVRVIAATNKTLLDCIEDGTFREDLFYRINVVQVEMPSLRDRRQDIPLLADHFFHHYNGLFGRNLKGMAADVYEWLKEYDFPGNVRELKNIIERAVILESGPVITRESMVLPSAWRNQRRHASSAHSLEAIEKAHIEQILQETGYNKSEASRRLGIARKTLREKIQRYRIHIP
jgi:transcriptional regulator with GAF, ATPase, and Fis domain